MAQKKVPVDRSRPARRQGQRSAVSIIVLFLKTIFLIFLFAFFLAGGAAAAVVVNYVNEAPPLDPRRLTTVETSYIYESEGREVAVLHQEQNRVVVSIDKIPEHVRLAFIAIEDERYYTHIGFDPLASARAAYANYQAGRIVQGASTITQQLVQNAYLTTELSYRRKIQEIWLAMQLEQTYGKEEILEMYLNRIYFGNGAYGIEAAAQVYFGKSSTDLNLAEAAMLAGVVRSPNYNNPFANEERALARMGLVLGNMKRLEHINEFEYNRARSYRFSYAAPQRRDYDHPHFLDYVIHNELVRILSAMPEVGSRQEAYRVIYNGGLRVYTTLEPSKQAYVEELLSREDLYPRTIYLDMAAARQEIATLPRGRDLSSSQMEQLVDEERGVAQPQAAIVVADPTTGRIRALGGGRDYRKQVDELLRFTSLRQPGSAIKPILAYAPAFEEGILAGAGSTIDDSPFTGPQGWNPRNYDNRFRGLVTARAALCYSYNIPAVRIYDELGPRVGVSYAQRMGINSIQPSEVDNLSLTLGGFTYGVSALDMAQAFAVLANGGVRVDLHTVERIEDRQGRVIYEHSLNPRQVISAEAAFMVNEILQDVVRSHSAYRLKIDRPVAAKTGTTKDFKDVYLAAYTPNLVATFWMGYDEPRMGGIRRGHGISTTFLREVFLEFFPTLEIREFPVPPGVSRTEICSVSGMRPTESCRLAGAVRTDYVIDRHAARVSCSLHPLYDSGDHFPENTDFFEDFNGDYYGPGPDDPFWDDPAGEDDPPPPPGAEEEPPADPGEAPPDLPPEDPPDDGGVDPGEDLQWWQEVLENREAGENSGG